MGRAGGATRAVAPHRGFGADAGTGACGGSGMTGVMPLRSRPLFTMELAVGAFLNVGGPQGGARRIANVSGGTFDGERMRGIVLSEGSDWQTLRGDGAV